MTREIKFRAWDGEKMHEKWCYFEKHSDDSIGVHDLMTKAIAVMQFTGLHDKNGKEIYEGDIIDFGGLKPIEIIWRNYGFKSKLIPFENSEPIILTQEGFTAFGEIIGNIYENPELLR